MWRNVRIIDFNQLKYHTKAGLGSVCQQGRKDRDVWAVASSQKMGGDKYGDSILVTCIQISCY